MFRNLVLLKVLEAKPFVAKLFAKLDDLILHPDSVELNIEPVSPPSVSEMPEQSVVDSQDSHSAGYSEIYRTDSETMPKEDDRTPRHRHFDSKDDRWKERDSRRRFKESPSPVRGRERERERDRERDRDRDRERERERDYDKEKKKEKERKDRDHHLSDEERDREERQKEREKDREKEREREQDRFWRSFLNRDKPEAPKSRRAPYQSRYGNRQQFGAGRGAGWEQRGGGGNGWFSPKEYNPQPGTVPDQWPVNCEFPFYYIIVLKYVALDDAPRSPPHHYAVQPNPGFFTSTTAI